MRIYKVGFIGHREVDCILVEEKLKKAISDLLYKKEYVEFYLGRNGEFDILVASTIKQMQKSIRADNSSIILVQPYLYKYDKFYLKYYDEIIYPISKNTHFKLAITKRNKWLVDNCDMLISYVNKKIGGAYKLLKYAQKQKIDFINIAF